MASVSDYKVEEYIQLHEEFIQIRLRQIRNLILRIVPDADEYISYGMPAYKRNGPIIYFAAFKKHIGIYPTAAPIEHFAEQLKAFKTSKGAIQLPHDREMPMNLIEEIVLWQKNRLENKE